jgi:hypothetical protein
VAGLLILAFDLFVCVAVVFLLWLGDVITLRTLALTIMWCQRGVALLLIVFVGWKIYCKIEGTRHEQ